MPFCTNCGQPISEDSKFCSHCGTQQSPKSPPIERTVRVADMGEKHPCPKCGEMFRSFEPVCPYCGFELRGIKGSKAIKDLADKLENAENDYQRIVIVKNFPIPNTREDILEFMLLAASNFDADYHINHLGEEDLSDAWLTKIEQCYQKACIAFKDQTDFKKVEEIYISIKKECEEKRAKIFHEEERQRVKLEQAEEEKAFKKSKFRVVLIVFAVLSAICCAVSFNDKRVVSGIVAIVMFALFMVAFLMGNKVLKEKVKNMRLIPTILAFVLFIPYMAFYLDDPLLKIKENKNNNIKTITWNHLTLGENIPSFYKTEGEILHDTNDRLFLYFYDIEESAVYDYIEGCKDFGYTIDSEKNGINFSAYNEEGYFLSIRYSNYSNEKQMTIELEDPKERNNIIWPTGALVADLPIPKALVGEIVYNSSSSFKVYILDIEESYFSEYVELCIGNGFDIEYNKKESSFSAENLHGYSLRVEYKGYNTLMIAINNY